MYMNGFSAGLPTFMIASLLALFLISPFHLILVLSTISPNLFFLLSPFPFSFPCTSVFSSFIHMSSHLPLPAFRSSAPFPCRRICLPPSLSCASFPLPMLRGEGGGEGGEEE